MKRFVILIFFIMSYVSYINAQDYNEYLSVARRHLASGNIEKAQKAYSIYCSLSNSRNFSFEEELSKSSVDNIKKEADLAYGNKEYEKAMNLYMMIPDNIEAQHTIGHMYLIGQGCEINNEKAKPWLRRAAEKGHANAAYKLAIIYGEEKNGKEYLKWMITSSENGYYWPLYCIAYSYKYGSNDVIKNAGEAFLWMKKAAEKDITTAMYDLGIMYYNGEGTSRDKQNAYYWMKKAADHGNKDAEKILNSNSF